eukprot:GHVS01023748.1.p1 GENE.GHVS01023748.1~~GHVS01023748.1.p1  ORF type:complete len:1169 (-),score=228.95 GHVS01023748.1:836-4288(-)
MATTIAGNRTGTLYTNTRTQEALDKGASSDTMTLQSPFPRRHKFVWFSRSFTSPATSSPLDAGQVFYWRASFILIQRRVMFYFLLLCLLLVSSHLFGALALPDPSLSVTIPSLSGRDVASSLLLPHHLFSLHWNTLAFYPSSIVEIYVLQTDRLPLAQSLLSVDQLDGIPTARQLQFHRPSPSSRHLEPAQFNWEQLIYTFHDIFIETGLPEHEQAVLLTFFTHMDPVKAEEILLNISPSSSAALASSLSLPPTDLAPLFLDPPQLKAYVLAHIKPPSPAATSFISSLTNIAASMPNPYSTADSVNSMPSSLLSEFFGSVTKFMAASGGTQATPLGDLAKLFASFSSISFVTPPPISQDISDAEQTELDAEVLPPPINVEPPPPPQQPQTPSVRPPPAATPGSTQSTLPITPVTPSSSTSHSEESIPVPAALPATHGLSPHRTVVSTYQSIADIAVFSAVIPNSGTAVLSAFITPAPPPTPAYASTRITTVSPPSSPSTPSGVRSTTSSTTALTSSRAISATVDDPFLSYVPLTPPTPFPVPSVAPVAPPVVSRTDASRLPPDIQALSAPSLSTPIKPPAISSPSASSTGAASVESPPANVSSLPVDLTNAILAVSSSILPLAAKLAQPPVKGLQRPAAASHEAAVAGVREAHGSGVAPVADETVAGQGKHGKEDGMATQLNSLLKGLNEMLDHEKLSTLVRSSSDVPDEDPPTTEIDETLRADSFSDTLNAMDASSSATTPLAPRASLVAMLSSNLLKPPTLMPQRLSLPSSHRSSSVVARPTVPLSAESPSLLHPLILYPSSPPKDSVAVSPPGSSSSLPERLRLSHPKHPSRPRLLSARLPELSPHAPVSSYTILLLSPRAAWRSSPPISAISVPIQVIAEPSPAFPIALLSPTQYVYPREPTAGEGQVAVGRDNNDGEVRKVVVIKESFEESEAERKGYRVVPVSWASHEAYKGDFSLSIWQTDPVSSSFSSRVIHLPSLSLPASSLHSLQILFPHTSCQAEYFLQLSQTSSPHFSSLSPRFRVAAAPSSPLLCHPGTSTDSPPKSPTISPLPPTAVSRLSALPISLIVLGVVLAFTIIYCFAVFFRRHRQKSLRHSNAPSPSPSSSIHPVSLSVCPSPHRLAPSSDSNSLPLPAAFSSRATSTEA